MGRGALSGIAPRQLATAGGYLDNLFAWLPQGARELCAKCRYLSGDKTAELKYLVHPSWRQALYRLVPSGQKTLARSVAHDLRND